MGRPRALDLETALPVILRQFWEHGYSGRTLDQLAAELHVTKPTLCRTLGEKDTIFAAALEQYYETYIAPAQREIEQAATLRQGLHAFFSVFVDRITNQDLPPGCFMGDTAGTEQVASTPIATTLQALHGRLARAVDDRTETALADGEFEPATSAVPVVLFILGQISALAAISRSSPTRKQLEIVVSFAINGLPWANPSG